MQDSWSHRAVHGSLFATITSFFPFKESHKDWARTNDRLCLVNCPTTSNKDDHNENDNQATGTSSVERVGGRVSAWEVGCSRRTSRGDSYFIELFSVTRFLISRSP